MYPCSATLFLHRPVFWCNLCRWCWPVRVVYPPCWNTGLLLFTETLREELQCTFQHLWATQSCCDLSSKLPWKQTLWTPCWTTAATPPPTGLPTTVRNRVVWDVLGTVIYEPSATALLGTKHSVNNNSSPLPAHPFLSSGHDGCLRILLENKPSSNQEGNLFTPLHCALWVLLQHNWMSVTLDPTPRFLMMWPLCVCAQCERTRCCCCSSSEDCWLSDC